MAKARALPRPSRDSLRAQFRGYACALALGAHPDDIELGCGGALAVMHRLGVELHAAVMSKCEDEVRDRERNLRAKEFLRACEVTGAKPHLYDLPNRELPEHRQEVMTILEQLQETVAPDLVFIPFLEDPHQDHSTVAYAAIRTFRRSETILQYEILRYGSHTFTPSLFVDITDVLDTKLAALRRYESQFRVRPYFDEESFRSLARTRGAQSGYQYAEGFVLYKMFW
ncbi:MAG: PIG-L family deacetylase [Euryarchaeota archaeon]|nr:PIG-L family deacetylase [Euryarchaeota archaeon]